MDKPREAAQVVEVGPEGTARTYAAFCVLREGRSIMQSPATFVAWVNERQRLQGYRVVAAFLPDKQDAVAAAGFRVHCMLSRGSMLYVDDLVTIPEHRSNGYAGQVFEWLVQEARRLGCERFHLDSGHQRHDAHRFYLNHGMQITAHHFSMKLD
jgi:GNAT superfamily N-acetyltransferase